MKTQEVTTTSIEELYTWDFGLDFSDTGGVTYSPSKENIKDASKQFGISEDLLEAINNSLNFLAESLVEYIKKDLMDIWKRLDKIEQEKVE